MADYVLIRDQGDHHDHHDHHNKDPLLHIDTIQSFLKKVYGILSAQLALTVFVCILIMASEALQKIFGNIVVLSWR